MKSIILAALAALVLFAQAAEADNCVTMLIWKDAHLKGDVLFTNADGWYETAREVKAGSAVMSEDIAAKENAKPLVKYQLVPAWLVKYLSSVCAN